MSRQANGTTIVSITTGALADVITAFEPWSVNLKWYLVEFEAGFFSSKSRPDDCAQEWIGALCAEIDRRRAGVPLPWDKVKALAMSVRPRDMVLIIAAKSDIPPPSWPLDITSPRFEIAIQGTDDYSWNVTTRNESVIAHLQHEFPISQILC